MPSKTENQSNQFLLQSGQDSKNNDVLEALNKLDSTLPPPNALHIELEGKLHLLADLNIIDLGDYVAIGKKHDDLSHFEAVMQSKAAISLRTKSAYHSSRETAEQKAARENQEAIAALDEDESQWLDEDDVRHGRRNYLF